MTRRRIVPALAAALLAAAVACGSITPAGDSIPALRTQLSRVDAALADRHYTDARRALDVLTRETVAARAAGRLSAEQADRILAAAARLAADLPAQAPAPQTSAPRPSTTSKPPERTGDQGEEKPDEENKNEDRKDEEKKDEGGDGHNSGNGPDDGQGN
jgi:hypothetical protein